MEEKKDIFDHLKPGKISTPDPSYFNQLANDIIASQEVKMIPLYKKPVVWLSAAAAAIAILFVFNFNSPEESTDVLLALNEIPAEELISYVDENIEEFETEMLVEIIPAANIETVELTETHEDVPPETHEETELNFDNIDTEDILDYINSEEIEIYDLDESEVFI